MKIELYYFTGNSLPVAKIISTKLEQKATLISNGNKLEFRRGIVNDA